jgi:hypothetical protein
MILVPIAWILGSVFLGVAAPLYGRAGAAEADMKAEDGE